MNKKTTVIILLVLSLVLTASCTSSSESMKYTADQKIEDFLYMYDVMQKEYPLFGVTNRKNGVTWLENKEDYIDRISKAENDRDFFFELSNILRELKDSHTELVAPYYFNYVIEEIPNVKGDIPPREAEFLVKTFNSAKENYVFWSELLDKDFKEYENNHNQKLNEGYGVSYKTLHNDDTVYLQLKTLTLTDNDCNEMYEFLKNNESCSNLIIDIRNNGGGYDSQWKKYIVSPILKEREEIKVITVFRGGSISDKFTQLIKEQCTEAGIQHDISDLPQGLNYPPEIAISFQYYTELKYYIEPDSSIDFNGDIYLLTNNRVSSSAEAFASFCKESGFAKVIGERTRGDGGSYGPIYFKLPNSGLIVRMRLQMSLNPDGSSSAECGTTPDIEVKSKDALKKALQIIESKKN